MAQDNITEGFVKPQLYKGQNGELNEGRFNVEMTRLHAQLGLLAQRLEDLVDCCGAAGIPTGQPDLPPTQPDLPPGIPEQPDDDDHARSHEHPHTHLFTDLVGGIPPEDYFWINQLPHVHKEHDVHFMHERAPWLHDHPHTHRKDEIVGDNEDDHGHMHDHPHVHRDDEIVGDRRPDDHSRMHEHPHVHGIADLRLSTEFVLIGEIFGD